MVENNKKRDRELGKFQIDVLLGLWKVGSGTLKEVTEAVRGWRPRAEMGGVYTTLERLRLGGMVRQADDKKRWQIEGEVKELVRAWCADVGRYTELITEIEAVEFSELGL